MIATKNLPATRVATPAPATRSQLDPRFNRLREIHGCIESKHLEFAEELDRVRGLFLRDKNANLIPGGPSKSHNETSSPEEGFKAAVARELGISPATAYRYMSVVKAVGICQQVEQAAEGEVIELSPGDCYKVTEKAQEQARELREEIATGGVPMNRALPAVKGLFIPGGSKGGKAATNHSQNCKAAMAKWATSLEHYYDFSTADRDYLDATFGELLAAGVIPESWLVMAAKAKGGRK